MKTRREHPADAGSPVPDPERAIRVLVADDHALFRRGVRAYLESHGMVVAGEARSGREAVQGAVSLHPDVVLMDVRMPDMDGLEALELIKKRVPDVSVLVLTAFQSKEYLLRAVLGGASGFASKGDPPARLCALIEETVRGEGPAAPAWWAPLLKGAGPLADGETGTKTPPGALTSRELDILRHLARGLGAVEIARLEGLSHGTVRVHCSSAFRKLGVSDRLQAVVLGLRQGWLNLEEDEG